MVVVMFMLAPCKCLENGAFTQWSVSITRSCKMFKGFFQRRAKFFETVQGYAVTGGTDTATLNGTSGDDTYTVSDTTDGVVVLNGQIDVNAADAALSIAFAQGGLTGRGPGKSLQRDFLPAPYNEQVALDEVTIAEALGERVEPGLGRAVHVVRGPDALAGVARNQARAGLTAVAEMLHGADNERLRRLGLTSLSTHGLLQDRPKAWVLALLRRLITAGLVEVGSPTFRGFDRQGGVDLKSGVRCSAFCSARFRRFF